jgi:hypothetical protein
MRLAFRGGHGVEYGTPIREPPMIELTAEQAVAAEPKATLQLVDPRTRVVYVLVRKEVYDLARAVVGGGKGEPWGDEADAALIRKVA